MNTRTEGITALVLAAALSAQGERPNDDALLAAFTKKSSAAQTESLERLRETLRTQRPELAALFECIAAANAPATERLHRLPQHHGKKAVLAGEKADAAIPMFVRYVFGVGVIETVDATPAGKETEAANGKRREIEVRQALLGLVPGADAALAVLQGRLDTDTAADRFAAFLHSWRNGPESFYEALDRTAGTPDAVFFYDAMLADFTSTVAKSDAGGAPPPTGLQAAHDALHDAFLAYRQYRGFREAIAYSLLLPTNVPLPWRLRRYEEAAAGSYSLRKQVVMLNDLLDGDVNALIDEIVRTSPRMQPPLWKGTFDPYAAWNELFARHVPDMIAKAGDTDHFLARAEQKRDELAAAIRTAAAASLSSTASASDPKR